MKQGWEYKKLGEVASFFRGLTYSGKDEVSFSNNVVLRSNNIDLNTNTINFDELKFISDSIIIPKDKKLKKNSIFMCMSNGSKLHLGKVAFIDKEYPYAFGGFMGLIVPKEDELMPKMAYYYFCSQKFKTYLSSIGNGANINNIKFVDIAKDTIPLPPKSTQLSIVSELDKINELIRLKKEQLKDYDNLAQSIFYEMFGAPVENEKGWEVKKLIEVSSLINGRAYKQNELLNEGKYKVLRVGNFFTNSNYYYSNLELDEEKYCYKGDLLFAWSASFGAFVWDEGKTIFHYHIWRVLFDEKKLNIYYYKYLLNTMTSFFMNDVHGIGMVHLTKAGMEQYNVPLPPLPLQHLFAQRIEQIEHQKSEVTKAITDLETLLASRMQYWFE